MPKEPSSEVAFEQRHVVQHVLFKIFYSDDKQNGHIPLKKEHKFEFAPGEQLT